MDIERWVDMPGFEEYYEISSKGNARSKDRYYINKYGKKVIKYGKLLKKMKGSNGYIRYGLKLPNDTKVYKVFAHRKVAEAFIDNKYNLGVVGHLDDVRDNNDYLNLYWTNHRDNCIKAVKSGRVDYTKISDSNRHNVILKSENEELYFKSMKDAGKWLGVKVSALRYSIKQGKECKGYKVYKVPNKEFRDIIEENDKKVNSCVNAKRVVIEKINGERIYCNSIKSCANKLGRDINSVRYALRRGTRCNGCKIYYIDDVQRLEKAINP